MTRWGDLLCKVTGKPFYPVRENGVIVCSECGEVFILDAPEVTPLRCRITKRRLYPYESREGAIRCSECQQIIYERKALQ